MNRKEMITKQLEEEIEKSILKLGGIPNYLIPKINISNDSAYPYLEIDNDGTIYIVIREKGIEYERDICVHIENTVFKLFEKITFELALNEEKSNENYSLERVKNRQRELLKIAIS
ncbi:hypothetical protein [uncultured Chryseobacterium sp.]|jgi:hypothetical protein|uniref:hypothetical protein n=1 Tax=uncultured Chryseobacterium sp. TaxID=259322 RepID=UPI0026130EDA|nr:hypothetical protein [uncultured Chryseobacterium sp.]